VVECPLAQVLAARFAFVAAADVKQIVDELEGDAKALERAAQVDVVDAGGTPHEGAAEAKEGARLARSHFVPGVDALLRRGQRPAGLNLEDGRARHAHEDVEHVAHHAVAVGQGGGELEGASEHQIAAQHGEGVAVFGVDGRYAAAAVGAVDDVVVQQRSAMHELDDDGCVAGALPADVEGTGDGAADARARTLGVAGHEEARGRALQPDVATDDLGEARLDGRDECVSDRRVVVLHGGSVGARGHHAVCVVYDLLNCNDCTSDRAHTGGRFFANAIGGSDAVAMLRHLSPRPAIRLHRFQTPQPSLMQRVVRRARHLPVVVPLCGGLCVAAVINAFAPAASAEPIDAVPTSAALPTVAINGPAAAPPSSIAPVAAHAVPPQVAMPPPASTRSAALEDALTSILKHGHTPYSAVVVMEAATGKVLAVAEHSTRGPSDGLALTPMSKAASVFKVVTASALLEAGVPEREQVCFHGGRTRMKEGHLKDSKRDQQCTTFGDVVAQSHNVAVAKLATKHLTPQSLRAHAARWGFATDGQAPMTVSATTPSPAQIPDAPFSFAEAAAGFGDVQLSAMHGAMIASVVANDGMLVAPTSVDVDSARPRRVIDQRTARSLRKMMTDTVARGTARRAFQGKPGLGMTAGGKTGSLAEYDKGLDHSWFVGFAPAEAPELVVAAVVVNSGKWHIKAPWLAKESLRLAFKERGATKKGSRVAAR